MSTNPPALKKITLRAMRQSDSDAIYAILRDPAVRLPFALFAEERFGKNTVIGWCGLAEHFNKQTKSLDKFYVIKNGREVIGYLGAGADPDDPKTADFWEVGYFLDPRYRGRGIVPALLADLAYRVRGQSLAKEFRAVVRPDNVASQRVLEKTGFKKSGVDKNWTPFIFHKDGRITECPPPDEKMLAYRLKL